MESNASNSGNPQEDGNIDVEEFGSEDSEILTTSLEGSSSIAKNKLKELNDILQDYSGFDEVKLDENAGEKGGSQVEDGVAKLDQPRPLEEASKQATSKQVDTANSEQVNSYSSQDDSLSDAGEDPTAEDENSSVVPTDSEISDTDSTSNATLIKFPNGEQYDLNSPNDHDKVMTAFRKFLKSSRETEKTSLEKDKTVMKMSGLVKDLQDKNQNLNGKLEGLLQNLGKSQETLKQHDASARAAINKLQQESELHIKSLKAKCASMQKDKESAVMNYARREKELLDAKGVAELAGRKSKEAAREREKAISQMKGMKMDLVKMKAALEKQEAENGRIVKEVEKWKEEANSHVIKVKWAQNKLKSETDLHNETKEKLAKAVQEIKRAKEEAETIRKDCQGMIKTYQESEEMRSNSLDSQLKEKELLLSQQEAKSGELEGIHKQQVDELRRLKQQYKNVFEENTVIKTRVECLEKERVKNEGTLKGYTEILNRQKKEAASMSEKLKELENARAVIQEKEEEAKKFHENLVLERESNEEMKSSEQVWKKQQQELLEFTQKVSTKNAELASRNEILEQKLKKTCKDLEEGKSSSSVLENELKTVQTLLETQTRSSKETASELSKRVEDKETTINHLTTQVEELKDEIRTLKRKHNSSVKDLTRQLHQARKRLEPYESASFPAGSGPTTEDGSMGSRASSDTSLDCVGKGSNGNNIPQFSHNSAAEAGSLSSQSNGTDVPETVVASSGEINTQVLIEKIVRLQRIHAKKNEKIDFLQDHVQQLVDEMQKKNKIIQHYILREENGLLMPETALTHAVTGERGSGKMSRQLTEEVNKRMQSVLEDALMKNITLKESMDALGSEIARLSASKS